MPRAFATPTSSQVANALLGRNYFPRVAKDRDELPPCFVTTSLTAALAKKVSALPEQRRRGFDAVTVDVTRFNLIPRRMGIPHPLPYSRLVGEIARSWSRLRHVSINRTSQFRPALHEDGRLAAMDYGSQGVLNRRDLRGVDFGAKYVVKADIVSFYPSLYTHAISWALVGHLAAKSNSDGSQWYEVLDKRFRDCNRGETTGVHIGPGTSHLAGELILNAVDQALDGPTVRFIDDYVHYAPSRERAEDFVLNLTARLGSYGLQINPAKTSITALPLPESPDWVRELLLNIPGNKKRSDGDLAYLDLAIDLERQHPEASAVKYAVKVLLKRPGLIRRADRLLQRLVGLAFHTPVVLPAVSRLLSVTGRNGNEISEELNAIVREHAKYGRTDGMTWGLHLLRESGSLVETSTTESIFATADCLAATLLAECDGSGSIEAAREIARKQTVSGDPYDVDRYWTLIYSLFRSGKISDPNQGSTTFETLRDGGFHVLRSARV